MLAIGGVGNVGGFEDRTAAIVDELFGNGLSGLLVQVGDGDRRPFPSEQQCGGTSNSGRSAGDESGFGVELILSHILGGFERARLSAAANSSFPSRQSEQL